MNPLGVAFTPHTAFYNLISVQVWSSFLAWLRRREKKTKAQLATSGPDNDPPDDPLDEPLEYADPPTPQTGSSTIPKATEESSTSSTSAAPTSTSVQTSVHTSQPGPESATITTSEKSPPAVDVQAGPVQQKKKLKRTATRKYVPHPPHTAR